MSEGAFKRHLLLTLSLIILFCASYYIGSKHLSVLISFSSITIISLLFSAVLFFFHKQEVTDKQKTTASLLQESTLEIDRLKKVNEPLVQKLREYKIAEVEVSKKHQKLQDQIDHANLAQKDLKEFVEKQIKTNEQLADAESKLKELLEKEKESKSMLSQTIKMLQETQSQLIHNEKMASLGQLTSGIAHEINNPLNFVQNGVEVLELYLTKFYNEATYKEKDHTSFLAKKDIDEVIYSIKVGAVRISEIISSLRIFSQLDADIKTEANINECINNSLLLLKNEIGSNISLTKELELELPTILCYPGQLNQAFFNIIRNSLQALATTTEGKIIIRTRKSDSYISISIKDNGPGMTKSVKEKIFEPFFSTKKEGHGRGLGMSISYGIITKHGGQISVNSSVGMGTEFTINIPFNKESFISKAS